MRPLALRCGPLDLFTKDERACLRSSRAAASLDFLLRRMIVLTHTFSVAAISFCVTWLGPYLIR